MELLASMRFAIALLTLISIASVIGTVLKQNEPASAYVNQFGPFWADLFMALGLSNVYSAAWFLVVLAFLVVSTSLCIARNTPKILSDIRTYKTQVTERSLAAFHHRGTHLVSGDPESVAASLSHRLRKAGWRVVVREESGRWQVACKSAGASKAGYLLAHSSIVLICLGGLFDGDLVVRAQAWLGDKEVYAGGGLIADVPDKHRLSPRNPSFRANLLVAEGAQSGTAVITRPGGVFLQDLPFSLELKKFVVEHYSTGMPKLFASEVMVHDRESGQAIPARIEVNRPFRHRGIDIFQSSFDDGGSTVRLSARSLKADAKPFEIQGVIGGGTQLLRDGAGTREQLNLELTGLRVINVENLGDRDSAQGVDARRVDLASSLSPLMGAANKPAGKRELRNVGPSLTYKLRDEAGQAREFHSYMLPVQLESGTAPTFLFGVRETPAEGFKYLRLPADADGTLETFFRIRQALDSAESRSLAAQRYALQATDAARPELADQLRGSAAKALALLAGEDGRAGGLQALADFIEGNVPEAERARASEILLRVLNGALFELAQDAQRRAKAPALPTDERTQAFMTQALMALGDLELFPAPVLLQLADFTHVQASVFQVARAPGRLVVYLGCAMLILGVFAMLYVRDRRLWVWIKPAAPGHAELNFAMSFNRRTLECDRDFERQRTIIEGSGP